MFALSRAGYLPRWLSLTGRRKTPIYALLVPGVIGLGLAFTGAGDLMIAMAVFGATISYILMLLSHVLLRINEPQMARPYRCPGGIWTTGVALLLAVVALISTFLVNVTAAVLTALAYMVLIAYFAIYSRHHLVAKAPEEEFAAIAAAEQELDSDA